MTGGTGAGIRRTLGARLQIPAAVLPLAEYFAGCRMMDSETVFDSIHSASIQCFAISPDSESGQAGPASVELTVGRTITVNPPTGPDVHRQQPRAQNWFIGAADARLCLCVFLLDLLGTGVSDFRHLR